MSVSYKGAAVRADLGDSSKYLYESNECWSRVCFHVNSSWTWVNRF